ncbi:MAG: hypothetical protein Q8P41_07120 [Pseudomonadota bacterium]|nr:hypothetical protein [Pseudomonadota bacterium]
MIPLLLLLASTNAHAATDKTCPWGAYPDVVVTGQIVSVDEVPYDMGVPNERETFERALRVCGATGATRYLHKWQGGGGAALMALGLLLFAGSAAGVGPIAKNNPDDSDTVYQVLGTFIIAGLILFIIGAVSGPNAKRRMIEAIESIHPAAMNDGGGSGPVS